MDIITLKELLSLTDEEVTRRDLERMTPGQIRYYENKYKTPPSCPDCGSILTTGPGFIPCDIIAICSACHWNKKYPQFSQSINYSG